MTQYITRPIWLLSLVSLFSDITSEMIYPIMPIYLQSIGFSILWIGILEGIAEAIAGLSQGYFGRASDLAGKRMPFVRLGYALTALSKPIIGVFRDPFLILLARSADRFGKGIRTGARDAILSTETTNSHKGRVFGFHRSMNTTGAVIGLLLALGYLYYHPGNYQALFLISAIPAVISVTLTFFVTDSQVHLSKANHEISAFTFLNYWSKSSNEYKKVVIGLLSFTLFNASDFFLLLKMKQDGLDDISIISIYIFYNLVYAVTALPLGILADRIGLKAMLIMGLCAYAILYFGMALMSGGIPFFFFFFAYGIYSSATEGISKAWISNTCESQDLGTALGTFLGFQSITLMIASILTGILWSMIGASTTFLIVGSITTLLIFYFLTLKNPGHVRLASDNPDPLEE
ncbi:MAG: MFS transporter [Candidatus Kapaibacteriota bacterium]